MIDLDVLRKLGTPTSSDRERANEAAAEIERLQEAKRRALAIADERGKESNALRQENERLQRVISQFADCVEKQAFDIPAPCLQTPILVSLAQQARFCSRNLEQKGDASDR
jgi:hypothetical protein